MQYYTEKRRNDEKISEYAARLEEMLLNPMPDLDSEICTTMLRARICPQLPEYVRTLIAFSSKKTYDELLTALDTLEMASSPHTPLITPDDASWNQRQRSSSHHNNRRYQRQRHHGHQQ